MPPTYNEDFWDQITGWVPQSAKRQKSKKQPISATKELMEDSKADCSTPPVAELQADLSSLTGCSLKSKDDPTAKTTLELQQNDSLSEENSAPPPPIENPVQQRRVQNESEVTSNLVSLQFKERKNKDKKDLVTRIFFH